jgi:hypothetical protein
MIAKSLLFLVTSAALAAAPPGKDIFDDHGNQLRISSPFSVPPLEGFYPVLMEMNSRFKDARWAVNHGNYNAVIDRGNMTFECRFGESRRTVVLLPCSSTGNRYDGSTRLDVSAGPIRDYVVFKRESREQSFLQNTLFGLQALTDLAGNVTSSVAIEFNTAIAPTDWRAYSGYYGVVVNDTEWRAMEPGARVAINHYVKSGGRLIVLVPDKAAASTLPAFPRFDDPFQPGQVGLGMAATLLASTADASLRPTLKGKATDDSFRGRAGGRSLIHWHLRSPEVNPKRSSPFTHFLMLLVLVVFAILIGPVNLFILAPAKRRHRLFFSVPVIALSTSALLLGFVLLSDGLGGDGHRALLIESRPGEGEAVSYVVQYQSSHCGALLNSGFESGASASIEHLGGHVSSAKCFLIADPDNLVGKGSWFASRTSQHYRVAATVPGRGRIELHGAGAAARLTSTFSFPIDALWFQDQEGRWWMAGAMKTGEPVGVQEVAEDDVHKERAERLSRLPTEIANLADQAALRRGSFIAFTSAPEAVRTNASIRWVDQAVLTGLLHQP